MHRTWHVESFHAAIDKVWNDVWNDAYAIAIELRR